MGGKTTTGSRQFAFQDLIKTFSFFALPKLYLFFGLSLSKWQ